MSRKKLSAMIIVAAFITISATSISRTAKPVVLPNDHFKNLQVLPKDISEHKLDSIMKSFAVSLGQRCDFCHAHQADSSNHHLDFASDVKDEKKAARAMMNMTKDINAHFNWMNSTMPDTIHTVICFTCHRGKPNPASENLVMQLDSLQKLREKK